MSCVVVISPLIIAGWPVISAAVTGVVASMGFGIVQSASAATNAHMDLRNETKTRVDMELEESEILQESAGQEQIIVERDGVRAIFSRDARGALKLCMEGEAVSKSELKRIGQELIDRVTQQYVYNRVVTELKQRNMTIVDEQVAADRTVKLRVRNI